LQLFIRVCDAPFSAPFHWIYPGTYQPLQAMSLLLADLLNYPHSDEASTSQGLVDAIFELYQVDHGMLTDSDPPRRKLSPSGREAWSMLSRLRSKALKQMDQDPHVVLPSFVASSHVCLCGERIANESLLSNSPEPAEAPQWETELHTGMPAHYGQQTHVMDTESSHTGFDWDEWDAYLGSASGTMV
jgi:hypothetical protein